MAKKGFLCTHCGNKKLKLTSALEYGHQRRRQHQQHQQQQHHHRQQQYREQRCIEGFSDMCNVCKGFTFFLNLDDNSDEGQQIQFVRNALEASPSTKRCTENKRVRERDNKERNRKHSTGGPSMPHHFLMEPNKRSRSCVPKQSTDNYSKGRRTQSMVRKDDWFKFVDPKSSTSPIIQELSQSSEYQEPVVPQNSPMYDCLAIEESKSNSSDQAENTNNILIEEPDDADSNDNDDDDDEYMQKSALSLQKVDKFLENSSPSNRKKTSNRKKPKLVHKPESTSTSKNMDFVLKESDLELQMDLTKKKELINKLCNMRDRLDKECEKAKTELYELQYKSLTKNKREKHSKRERGGALITCPEISEEKLNGGQIKDKVVSLDNQLLNIVKERHSYKFSSPFPEAEESPVCSSSAVSTVDNMYRQPSNSLRVLMSPKFRNFVKSSSRIFTPIKRLPQVCYSISYVQRAKYSGFISDPRTPIFLRKNCILKHLKSKEPPMPQFSTVPCSRKEMPILFETKPNIDFKSTVARELLVTRTPIHCPDFDCKRLTFIADFNRHLLHDHRTLTIERINIKQPKTFFLDPNITLLDKAKCSMLYFVRNKVIDTHSRDLKELLPVLVMTTRVRMSDMYGFSRLLKQSGVAPYTMDTELFLIWLTSFIPKNSSVTGTISIWSTRKVQNINTLYVHTSDVYDVRAPQDMHAICHSTSSVVIPTNVIRHMTNNGENLLAVQIQVY